MLHLNNLKMLSFHLYYFFCSLFHIIMWNQILKQSRSLHKFDNIPVLVLGNKHSGKRTFIDSLFEISKTVLPRRTTSEVGRLRDKAISSVIDYAYLNTTNLNDPDNKSQSRLEFYIVDDQQNKQIVEVLVSNPALVQKLVIVIMLDYSAPWTFEIELDRWATFTQYLLSKAGFSISKLDQMKAAVEKQYITYKQPEFDEDGKLKKIFQNTQQLIQSSIAIPQGILANNIRLPLIVAVNKSDLQSSVLRDKEKISFVEYHLRKFCLSYGGTLIYTSTKNHSNLDVFYEYILHRGYNFTLRFKPYTLNEESVFIPLGADNFQLLNDSIKISNQSFSEAIPQPSVKKLIKQQVLVEQDNQFFKKYIGNSSIQAPTSRLTSQNSATKTLQQRATVIPGPQKKSDEVTTFYANLLKGTASRNTVAATGSDPQKRLQAFQSLTKHTNKLDSSTVAKKLLQMSSRREATRQQRKEQKKQQKKQDKIE